MQTNAVTSRTRIKMEFNLSQKIGNDERIYMGDVKNFVKILKEEFSNRGKYCENKEIVEFIDKKAGGILK